MSETISNITNTAGFKLARFEVYNWGTFDEKIWVIEPKGYSALLTGENGSGKSTLVDALLTLLVPNVKRNYNLASGNEKKERTELTYVRGAYAREQNELGNGQTKFFRGEENYSVLLAKFQDALTHASITIGQFFWFENATLHKLFFASHAEISIQADFSQIKNAKEIRNRLKNTPQTTLFTTFSEYQAYFIRYVGLRSEKGLDLFNQITAIKEINRLNDFVRKHMLNENEPQELLNSLYMNYQNLDLAYKAILLAKNQLDALNPLAEEARKFDGLQLKISEFQKERQALPSHFASYKKTALLRQKSAFSLKLIESEESIKNFELKLKSIHEQKLELTKMLSQDESIQEFEKFKLMLNQQEEKKNTAQKQSEYYAQCAQILNLIERPNLKEFSQNLESIQSLKSSIETQLATLREQYYSSKKNQEASLKEIEILMAEVRSLKNRNNRLPMHLVQIREELFKSLNIPMSAIPFIAELIKVQDLEWEGAIEKLLHSFALRMLVPHDLYGAVCQQLNQKNIGARLVFQKVDESLLTKLTQEQIKKIESNKLFHKLEFREASPYAAWLQDKIIKDYDYACVTELSIFQKQFKAMTSQGLIKHGMSLNEKDDRFSIQDKNRFILGWSNQEKLDWFLKEIQNHQKIHAQASESIQSIERLIHMAESELNAIQALLKIENFSIIDWQSSASEINNLRKRQAALVDMKNMKNMKDKSFEIQKNLQNLEEDLHTQQNLRDQFLKDIAVLTHALQELNRELEYCEKILNSLENSLENGLENNLKDNSKESVWLKAFIKKQGINFLDLDLKHYGSMEKTAVDELNAQFYKAEAERQHLQVGLVRKMTQFKANFNEYAQDLDTTIDSLPAYLNLQKKLQTESLPEHERRFIKLLSKSVMDDMAAFKSTLELAYENIEDTIQELNSALMSMNYSENTYVQLQLVKSKDVEIREFHHLLKNILSDARERTGEKTGQKTDHEFFFAKIKTLLDRLKTEERWCKKVTDVRNWADFSVLEKTKDTHEQKNYYSDSAGLSGGQKAKLAFTILGSAIAYQYGLNLDDTPLTHNSKSRANSLRFIVVDEAFSKSDEKNSRYAMELFQKLKLQVMVVTPKDKIHVVEPYIQSIFLTYMDESKNRSQLINLSLNHIDHINHTDHTNLKNKKIKDIPEISQISESMS